MFYICCDLYKEIISFALLQLLLFLLLVVSTVFSGFVARNFHAMTFSCYLINLTFHSDVICKEKLAKFVITCLIGFICFRFSMFCFVYFSVFLFFFQFLILILMQWENWFYLSALRFYREKWISEIDGFGMAMGINFCFHVKIE